MRKRSFSLLLVLSVLVAAPTAGDIGSCGTAAEALDAKTFFTLRLQDECDKCHSCGYVSRACVRACAELRDETKIPSEFPPGCHPVVHDGEVCLRAIESLGCSAFGDLVSDAPIAPTECDFCPIDGGR